MHPRQRADHGTGHLLVRSAKDAGRTESAAGQGDRSPTGRAAGGKSGGMAEARGGRTLKREMRAVRACHGYGWEGLGCARGGGKLECAKDDEKPGPDHAKNGVKMELGHAKGDVKPDVTDGAKLHAEQHWMQADEKSEAELDHGH